mmetsp:Transcript_8164/g.34309  ORF Transcript_8164/g.34309 Transcript_8164/m.34309 type:complete len:135 (-) Transcript_8164:111-515(-)|eukprot:CAMPEP_0114606864 /NCGR_PEP_ID=MMETSP0168-20121206/1780_1 /TAXON_ID=95228 ORGANISM="Vannella sp., Strain DIVA3 517/6/12" /NCGR_SAMPLE_ID=MMETSP0168 /ASSEMBLY_ACC=CAM_ASM_000044 /LENGTH=134 /DNA_ID=CAMNT_0001817739 /DNA_START=39 /DNA_END=443 /DNA_ORIENTATION=+
MGRFLKQGRVVIVVQGRYAGRKAVIVKNFDNGTDARPYGHAVVAGVDRNPLKITKSMSKKKVAKRSKVKPFVKVVNYNHLMPTRYNIQDAALKSIGPDSIEKGRRNATRKTVKKAFEDRYNAGKNKWFFTKLRF